MLAAELVAPPEVVAAMQQAHTTAGGRVYAEYLENLHGNPGPWLAFYVTRVNRQRNARAWRAMEAVGFVAEGRDAPVWFARLSSAATKTLQEHLQAGRPAWSPVWARLAMETSVRERTSLRGEGPDRFLSSQYADVLARRHAWDCLLAPDGQKVMTTIEWHHPHARASVLAERVRMISFPKKQSSRVVSWALEISVDIGTNRLPWMDEGPFRLMTRWIPTRYRAEVLPNPTRAKRQRASTVRRRRLR